jgi:hypothetical protein
VPPRQAGTHRPPAAPSRAVRALLTALALVIAVTGCATSAAVGSGVGVSRRVGDVRPGRTTAPLALPERNASWPGPAVFRIGNAISPLNYWMTAWTLNDVFKMTGWETEIGDTSPSSAWVPIVNSQWETERTGQVRVDEHGWPTSMLLHDGRRADRLAAIVMGAAELHGQFPAGRYTLTYDGSGRIEVDGATVAEERAGRMVLEYDGSATLILYVTETDPEETGDYLRNISILRPDAVAGETFTRAYIDYLSPFSVIRPLHFFGDQLTYGPRIGWEDRKPLDYSHWGGSLGGPYEVAMDLANESVSDLWINIPIAADDRFVRELARLAHERLDSNRKVYIELGNELWNYADPYTRGRRYALEQARELWPDIEGTVQPYSYGDPVSEPMMIYSWQGMRTVQIARIVRKVWAGDADRVVVVAAGQTGASAPHYHPSRYLLESPVYVGEEGGEPCGTQIDAFAVAPYIGEEEGAIEFERSSPEAFLRDAIEYVRGEGRWGEHTAEPGMRYQIRSDAALAAEFGLPLITYEGGQHFTGSRYTRDVINVHPMMRDLYEALLTVWQQEGGGLFVHYAGIIPRGRNEPGTEPSYYQSENFGIKELQTQTREEAPKWDGVLRVMERIGQVKRR